MRALADVRKCSKTRISCISYARIDSERGLSLSYSLADVAQLVEHHHGKVGVVGSIPTIGSDNRKSAKALFLFLSMVGIGEGGRGNGSFPVEESSESSSAENREVFREESATTISYHRLR